MFRVRVADEGADLLKMLYRPFAWHLASALVLGPSVLLHDQPPRSFPKHLLHILACRDNLENPVHELRSGCVAVACLF